MSRTDHNKQGDNDRKNDSHESAEAHKAHLPLAFPDATRSTMLGWEQVTACTAVILDTQPSVDS